MALSRRVDGFALKKYFGWASRETMELSVVGEALERAFGCRAANTQARSFKNAS